MPESPQSRFRRRSVGILLGLAVVVGAVALREFLDVRGDAPIVDPYREAIDQMSLQSPRVRERLTQYYAKHQRQTVASKHFPWLCDEIEKLAAEDGITGSMGCPLLLDRYEKP